MSPINKEHFAKKHHKKEIDPMICNQIRKKVIDNRISCHILHEIADKTGASPAKVGEQTDLLEYRLTKCQLGLFGYKNKKRLNPDIDISPELDQRIDSATDEKKISCINCWNIARDLNIKRLEIGSACEKKGLRIKPCQLGAF